MGKAKPKQMRRKGKGKAPINPGRAKFVETMTALRQPKFRVAGPMESLPRWRIKPAVFYTSVRVQGGIFNTHTGITGSSLIAGAAAAYGGAMAFALDDTPDAAAYISLFDQFILYRVVVNIEGASGGTLGGVQKLYVVVDYDNTTILTSIAAAESYQNCQIIRCFNSDAVRPENLQIDTQLCIDVDAGAGTTIIPANWEDCATANTTDHMGIKFWYDTAATTNGGWTVSAQYFLGFRNTQ
jgi:hypothetical protein